MATLKANVTADISGFTAAMKKCQSIARGLQPVMTGIGVVAAGAMAAVTAAAVGIKNAIDVGGALSELSARTGVAAGQLAVLQMAFTRAGVGAETVGPLMNKMQKAIAGAGTGSKEATDALASIGLTFSDLSGLSPDKQFQAIGAAIAKLPDPAAQAAASMALFGRSGGALLALFKDSGAMGDAANAVGGQAALLTKNANMFDRAGDILNTIGNKLQGLFVGMADQIVPVLMPLIEQLDGIDLSGIGQQLGNAIAIFIQGITDGSIWSIIGNNAIISLETAVNYLWSALLAVVKGVATYVVEVVKLWITLFQTVASVDFWVGMVNTILGAAMQFTGNLLAGGADFAQQMLNNLVGAAYAFGPLMQEIAKSAVMMFTMLTKPEFWAGMISALIGAAQKFRAVILETVATLLDKISIIPGMGAAAKGATALRQQAQMDRAASEGNQSVAADMLKPFADEAKARLDEAGKNVGAAFTAGAGNAPQIADSLKSAANALQTRGAQASASGSQLLGPMIDRVTGQVTQGIANIGNAVKEGWNTELIDTSGREEAVKSAYGELATKVAQANAETAKQFGGANGMLPDGEIIGGAAKGGFGPLFTSSLAKIGGGGFAVGGNAVLDENRKQTGYLKTIANALTGGSAPALA